MRRRAAYGLAVLAVLGLLVVMLSMLPQEASEGDYERDFVVIREEGRFPCDEYKGRCMPQLIIAGLFKGGTSQLSLDLGLCHPDVVSPASLGFEPAGVEEGNLKLFMRGIPVVRPEDDKLVVVKMPKVAHYLPEDLAVMNEVLPSTKYVLMLRNPAERDYSHFRMALRRWSTRGMDGVELPSACKEDTSHCLLMILHRYVLLPDEEWSQCARQLSGEEQGYDEEWAEGERKLSDVPLAAWIRCIRDKPRSDWRRKVVIIDQTYAVRLQNLYDAFGEGRVHVTSSEDFFAGDRKTLADVQTFAGLVAKEDFLECSKALGSGKAKLEPQAAAEQGIASTRLGAGLRALLLALHRINIESIERLANRKFHWS